MCPGRTEGQHLQLRAHSPPTPAPAPTTATPTSLQRALHRSRTAEPLAEKKTTHARPRWRLLHSQASLGSGEWSTDLAEPREQLPPPSCPSSVLITFLSPQDSRPPIFSCVFLEQVPCEVTQTSMTKAPCTRDSMTRALACYFSFHTNTPLSAHAARVKPCSRGLPRAEFASHGYILPPKLTWRTNLKSDGHSCKQSIRRFICYFYYLISSSLAYFLVRIQYMICLIYKIHVN